MTNTESCYAAKPWTRFYPESTPSHFGGLAFANLGDLATKTAKNFSERLAFSTCLANGMSGSLSFAQLEEFSNRFAYYLKHILRLNKGDRVAVQLPNCLSYPIVVLGILKAGLVLVNVNPLYTVHETEHILCHSEVSVVIILDIFVNKLKHFYSKNKNVLIITANVSEFFSKILNWTILGKQKFIDRTLKSAQFPVLNLQETLIQQAKFSKHWQPWVDGVDSDWIKSTDLACLQYTGGTTGEIKGAMLTHQNILSNIQQLTVYAKKMIYYGEDIIMTALPLYHIFSFTVNFLVFYSVGAHNILIPNPRPIKNLKKVFEKYPITWMTGVNTLYHALIKEDWFLKNPPRSLRISIAGGMPLFSSTVKEWKKIVGSMLIEGYGLTEASPVVAFNPLCESAKNSGVGIPVPDTDLKIIDENGFEVPIGMPGEICIKGPQVASGYWKDSQNTQDYFNNGWFYTGDIGLMDEDGFFKIVDRKKDMILVSGFNVYPNEIEDCIMRIPEVTEVAVVGIPDDIKGETICAYIVSKNKNLKAEDVRLYCREHLTSYKVPKIIEFRSELVKTNVGKILRKILRAEAINRLKNEA